ncbi:hypothetical protein [Polyangium sp. 6x1]|uniref:hypothetical protein n=1 Tax=Polyangium sp. 6x1 TaxID=3042689 RepID=UPI0024828F33|nr:hypothetical protein [Polyangium sp. 6x1]MDI1442462.1 hypothetical protein [Polyangium sp. 6x1]
MTTTGLLDLGAAEIVDRRTGELLGYAFTVAHGKGQLQRWLLFRHPQNELEIRPPPAAMANWSLADWQASVPGLWRPNGFYVWAQADVYQQGGTYDGVTWTQLPPASRLPKPTFPERPGSNYQLDWTGKVADVLQEDWRGRAFVVRGLTQASSIEYWSLPARYQPAGNTRTAAVAVGVEEASSLDVFVEECNRTWSSGGTFVITGCINYHGPAAPFAP